MEDEDEGEILTVNCTVNFYIIHLMSVLSNLPVK